VKPEPIWLFVKKKTDVCGYVAIILKKLVKNFELTKPTCGSYLKYFNEQLK